MKSREKNVIIFYMKFVELAKSLKEKILPAYYIEGEEAHFRDHAVESIRAALSLAQPALNDMRIEGETLKGEKLYSFRDALYTAPFFDNYRLVRAYGFYPTEREAETVIKPYLEKPCPSTVLVIVNESKRANAADFRRKAGIAFVDCSRESEETLSKWLFGVMRRMGLAVDADAVTLTVRYCAQDAARMKREAEKLLLLLGEGGRVTRKEIEEHVAKDTEYKIYELTQAASRRNFTEFSEILDDMMKKGYDENAALASLCSHFKTLYEVSAMRGSDAETAKVLGMKPYAVQKNRELAARLGRERVREAYLRLYELSSGSKSGLYTKTGALNAAIAEIFFG